MSKRKAAGGSILDDAMALPVGQSKWWKRLSDEQRAQMTELRDAFRAGKLVGRGVGALYNVVVARFGDSLTDEKKRLLLTQAALDSWLHRAK